MATSVATQQSTAHATLITWFRYMAGNRDAILRIAGAKNALWIGMLFVLSAGFARDYDGAYLAREPWPLVLPLGASLATSMVLYGLVYLWRWRQGTKTPSWWQGYLTLLTFYWMTAPLAWLYAIPVEHFLSSPNAVRANFLLLGIVSAWRVLLITRAISVWLGTSYWAVLWVVLFFGDTVLLLANFITPMPVWDMMGGVRLSESESVVLNLRLSAAFYGTLAWLVLGIGMLVLLAKKERATITGEPAASPSTAGLSLWAFACVLLVAGFAILPFGQPAQAKRWEAEQLLRGGKVEEGLKFMSATPREQFPPHWDPPPRTSYGEDDPDLPSVLAVLGRFDSPQWLREIYDEKALQSDWTIRGAIYKARKGNSQPLNDILDYVDRAPPEFKSDMIQELKRQELNEFDEPTRERIRLLLGEKSGEEK